ncbi:MAG: hypothetical protein MUO75_08205 [Actinobacteria bacterium]|nr:hypothetical protein [Actinomycetota bacterium]
MKGDGTTDTESLTVPNSARSTVQPRSKLGTGNDPAHDFSAKVECTNGQMIVAERPMYFDYKPGEMNWNGGHDAVGFPFGASSTTVNDVVPGTGMRKFVDSLPGLGAATTNNLGQYIPVAVPNTTTFLGDDYYEIELGQYTQQMHSDLPPTTLRGYRQTNTADPSVSRFSYLGPTIIARKGTPVRIKFTNKLPTGSGGDLFLPVDTSVMGAGMGPAGGSYTQNRGTIHLHGGLVPWISDGTPHQWTTPAGESTPYPKGVSVQNVPDMPAPGDGSMTFYYSNEQSARLMFYHDHAFGITRLNVYAGEAAPSLLQDTVEQNLVNDGVIPADQIPLVVQDKTFVPDDAQLAAEDPTWNKAKWGGKGSLWYPHVYMPNQNPADPGGMNAFGRWHYGPWFWPPTNNITNPPVANPYAGPGAPWENATMPGTPTPSMAMEAFMDTPVVNGTAYPYLEVQPKSYRLRVLNAADDRFFNLQFYEADPTVVNPGDGRRNTEVKMVPAAQTSGYPQSWPIDGREGGVPDPATSGPSMIQIGNEGGFLPAPTVMPNQPIDWNRDQTAFNFGNLTRHTLLLGPAERADVVVDFSQYSGKTLILYNDCPAPVPALDPRYDYYTGAPDMTDTGGSPTPQAGYGPNTRTVMQIKVAAGPTGAPFNLAALQAAFTTTPTTDGAFKASQDPILIPNADYNSAYNGNFPADTYTRIYDTAKTFNNLSGNPVTVQLQPKAIQDEMGEAFDTDYGRQSGFLGLELPNTGALNQNFLLYPFLSPPVDIVTDNLTAGEPQPADGTQIWKVTHNGVDVHVIHFHLYNVQVINRVSWDNRVIPPDPNELGWKESVRMNPLEDTIVALRPYAPTSPFAVPDSIRLLDPTKPAGTTLPGGPLGFTDTNGEPVTILNEMADFGWEYVWHCHLLAHEEMDMMHEQSLATTRVAPAAPPALTPTINAGPTVKLDWTDSSTTETHFIVQRGAAAIGPWTTLTNMWSLDRGGTGAARTYTDTTVQAGTTYYYQVIATNAVGFLPTVPFAAPAVDFPTVSASSTPVASGAVIIP